MTVSTTLALANVQDFTVPTGFGGELRAMDMVSLADGGVAVAGYTAVGGVNSGYAILHGPELAATPAGATYPNYSDGRIDQLNDGRVVVVDYQNYRIIEEEDVVTGSNSAGTNSGDSDVTALSNGGFAVVGPVDWGGSPKIRDIECVIHDAQGNTVKRFDVTDLSGDNQETKLCALSGGGFVVAWHRPVPFTTQTRTLYAIYEDDGTVRKDITVLDSTGTTNRDIDVVALADGGFGLVYQDSEWPGGAGGVSYVRMSATGDVLAKTNVRPDGQAERVASDAVVTVLSTGQLVVSYTLTSDNHQKHQVYAQLLDPETGARLTDAPQLISDSADDSAEESILAGYGGGGVLFGWRTSAGGDAATAQVVRQSVSDGANDTITGDGVADSMIGAGGRDRLFGAGGADTLHGGAGKDILNGGEGADVLAGSGQADVLAGGLGKDIYLYERIKDSTPKGFDTIRIGPFDRIDLSAIDARTTKAGDQKFDLVDAFTGKAGELIVAFHADGPHAGNTTVEMDVNGDGLADGLILLEGDQSGFSSFAL